MSNDPCATYVELTGGKRLHFEEYLVRDRAPTDVESIDLSAAARASPAPGVLEAIAEAQTILVCPSNPIVSIGPILAVPGIREALDASSAPIVAVSPIVGGAPIYRDWIDGFVFDELDRSLMGEIEALGLETCALDTMMVNAEISEQIARASLDLADRIR